MSVPVWPLQAYREVLVAPPGAVRIAFDGGSQSRHETERWLGEADAVDNRLLDSVIGPALDLGCGPGRLTAALAARGIPALGVDLSAAALAVAAERGAPALLRDLYGRLPGEGRWRTVLVVDGNVGIGGDPRRLLRRTGELLAPGGVALVEVHPLDIDRRGPARLVAQDGRISSPFPWAEVGAESLLIAATPEWTAERVWKDADRRFVALRRC